MRAARLTSKGQITLPQDLREKIDFIVDEKSRTHIPVNKNIDSVFGILHKPQVPPVSTHAMKSAVGNWFRIYIENIYAGRVDKVQSNYSARRAVSRIRQNARKKTRA